MQFFGFDLYVWFYVCFLMCLFLLLMFSDSEELDFCLFMLLYISLNLVFLCHCLRFLTSSSV